MLTIRAMSDGSGYSERHLEHSDYYAEGERVTGTWQGRGAELLGLAGEVESEQFEAIRQGFDPQSGEFLRQRHSADRFGADGSVESRGRNLYDFTISAPKSVSVMAKVGGDERLVEAHRKAVNETLKELELQAASRVRKDSANDDRTTGNLVMAVYHHDTSRELDPQLHTHAVAANLTYDGAEGKWKALQASDIYEQRAYLTEVYRNALAREVRSLGYETEGKHDTKGKNLGFEIKGVSPELIEKYSQRSQQRDRAIEEFTKEHGRKPTDDEVAVLVRESRADKLIEISTDEVHRQQRERLSPDETLGLDQLREDAFNRGSRSEREPARGSLDYAEQHVFERVSVARDHELLTEALRHGRGRIELDELKGGLALQQNSGELLRAGKEVATRESLDREREMVARINRGVDQYQPLGNDRHLERSPKLHPEQRNVIKFVLESRDFAVNIRGAAGTGKTATLQELNRGLSENGYEVLAVAPSMSAVEELQKVGFEDAMTVQRLLQDSAAQANLSGKVVILDEAGMVSGQQMAELLKLAEEQSARIVFSGDTRQIRSVEASDALRILERESALKSVALTQVKRQTGREYREAIKELRRDPEQGFAKLEAMGAIREVSWEDRSTAVQQAYSEAKNQFNADGKERNVLVVAATHEEIEGITRAIRSAGKQSGELGESIRLERHVSLNWTTAQKQAPRNYQEGQIVKFHRAVKDIAKHEVLEVVGVQGNKVSARNEKGGLRDFGAKQAKSLDVYEKREIEVAPDDKLLLLENRREPRFRATNGELVKVSHIDEKRRIHLEDGRVLPENYKTFAHGYAITGHRSQGKSVDSVIIAAEGMRRELFYVAASRGRESISIITSDKERLREFIGRSNIRQSASELARKAEPTPKEQRSELRQGKNSPTQFSSLIEKDVAKHQDGARVSHGTEQNWPASERLPQPGPESPEHDGMSR